MVMKFSDLRCKEVINIKDGTRLGYVDDIEFETCTAKILRIIVYGRSRFFGLFGRDEDIVIDWCDIEVIGTDTVLVRFDSPFREVKRKLSIIESLLK
ncbi:MAG: YlmC/YmxH family sporulation protein [Clostridiales bacterium]|nr:YlmC/YmxH family sporulation protein [Clostridiales bacterium]